MAKEYLVLSISVEPFCAKCCRYHHPERAKTLAQGHAQFCVGPLCNALADDNDFMKLAVIPLMQARLNFQNVCESLGNYNRFFFKKR